MKSGLVATCLSTDNQSGSIVKLTCETDFAAKSGEFASLALRVARNVLNMESHQRLIEYNIPIIKENIDLCSSVRMSTETGIIDSYIHPPGKIGVLLKLEGDIDPETIRKMAHELVLQVASANPYYVYTSDVPVDVKEREQAIIEAKIRAEGKPDHIVPKIAEGMMNKFYSQVCLMEQKLVKDNKRSVRNMLEQAGIKNPHIEFTRFEI
jgi:elongation factor Ts